MHLCLELVSNLCNSKCKWCFHNYLTGDKIVKGFITVDNFKRFIDMNADIKPRIIPFSHGESLIHPNWVEMIRYGRDRGYTYMHVDSNFAMDLTQDHFDLLSTFDRVYANVGGATAETHHTNMGTSLEKVFSNFGQLQKTIRDKKSSTIMTVMMVINKHNKHEVSLLHDEARRIFGSCIQVVTKPVYLAPADSTQDDIKQWIEANLDSDVECRDRVTIKDGKYIITPKKNYCEDQTITIRHDGTFHLCCRARSHSEGSVGNAFEFPLTMLMKTQKYTEYRKLQPIRKYISYCEVCS